MELFNAKDFMNNDGEHASPEAASRIANEKLRRWLEEKREKEDAGKPLGHSLVSALDFLRSEG